MSDLISKILNLESNALGFNLSYYGLFLLSLVCIIFKIFFTRK